MTRQIKFRAWWGGDNKMENWDEMLESNYPAWQNLYFRGENPILMQFTGLLDKNGKEIYEGDILRYSSGGNDSTYKDGQLVVEWGECDYDMGVSGYGWKIPNHLPERYEVIGNIYENPALTNKK